MASISGANTIVLKANYNEGGANDEEGIASGAISPGMNVGMSPAADSQYRHTWAVAATDNLGTGTSNTGGRRRTYIAKEDTLQGKTVNDAYANGDNIFVHMGLPNDVVQVLVASGQTIAKGVGLSAGTNGKWTADTTLAAAEALEGSGGALAADTLMRVRLL
jgi:hypothetical protein